MISEFLLTLKLNFQLSLLQSSINYASKYRIKTVKELRKN